MSEAEPVLDVPAIPYSEVEQQQRERAEAVKATPKTRSSKRQRPAPRRKARSAPAPTPKVKSKRGEVGPAVVAAVEVKIAEGMNVSQACAAVAAERGMKAGAVAANYYRLKRNQSAKTRSSQKPSAVRKVVGDVTPPAIASGGLRGRRVASDGVSDIDAVLADLSQGVKALSDIVQAQETEVAELRSRLDQVGVALGG